jgi:hypothetical protein
MTIELPDEPRWVEAHGMAGDPASWRRALGHGFAIGNDAAQLVVVAGDADPAGVIALGRELTPHAVLVTTEELASALGVAGRVVERVIVHTLADPDELPDLEGAVLLPAGTALLDVPGPLARELASARGPIWTVVVDGQPAAFAHAPWRSARWFDVAVDTLPGLRQKGLGTLVAAALIRDERRRGGEPVWAADSGNAASLRLAHRLGFQPMDEIWVAPPVRVP